MCLNKKLLLVIASSGIAGLSATQAHAVVQADYNFEDTVNPTFSTDVDTDTKAFALTFGNTGQFGIGNVGSVGRAAYLRVNNTNDTVAAAITNGDFLTFTLDLDGATSFNIDQVSYLYHLTDTNNGRSYSTYLFSSIASGSGGPVAGTEIASATFNVTADPNDFDDTAKTIPVGFNAALAGGYGGLTGPVTFWIVLTDTDDTNDTKFHAIDNIVVNGVVPEPGSLALLGFGLFCLLRRRRSA